MGVIIGLGSAIAYAASFLLVARRVYQVVRPSRVPLCGNESGERHANIGDGRGTPSAHYFCCYKRFGPINRHTGIKNTQRAVMLSLLAGLAGPVALIVYLATQAIVASPPETDQEREVRLKELETKNAKLQAELDRDRLRELST